MTKFLLIDGNSIGFSAQFGNNLSYKDSPTQAIFGVLRTLKSRLGQFPDHVPIVFWDGRSWRYSHYPEYKSGRDSDEKMRQEREAYKAQRPNIVRSLKAAGIVQEIAKNMEADDLIARHVASLRDEDSAVILSGDKDMIQLVRENVVWVRPITKVNGKSVKPIRVDIEDLPDQMGYETPRDYLIGKLLLGDKSDKLGGVNGIGDKAAPMVVKHWNGSIKDMVVDVRKNGAAAVPPSLSRYRKKIVDFCNNAEEVKRISRDLSLMQLINPSKNPEPVEHRVIFSGLDKGALQSLCDTFGFDSILREFEDFIENFEAAQPHIAAYLASAAKEAA